MLHYPSQFGAHFYSPSRNDSLGRSHRYPRCEHRGELLTHNSRNLFTSILSLYHSESFFIQMTELVSGWWVGEVNWGSEGASSIGAVYWYLGMLGTERRKTGQGLRIWEIMWCSLNLDPRSIGSNGSATCIPANPGFNYRIYLKTRDVILPEFVTSHLDEFWVSLHTSRILPLSSSTLAYVRQAQIVGYRTMLGPWIETRMPISGRRHMPRVNDFVHH